MARTDAIVLGAGIVGTSIALHLAKRGLARRAGRPPRAGRGDILRQCRRDRRQHAVSARFPARFSRSAAGRAASARRKRTTILRFLPRVAPWLLAFRAPHARGGCSKPRAPMRPLFARAVAEHEALLAEAGAARYLRKTGWLKLYRSERAFAGLAPELDLAASSVFPSHALDRRRRRGARARPAPVFRHAVHWPEVASVTNPLAVTQAYAARFGALGGIIVDRRRALAPPRAGHAGASIPQKVRSTPTTSVVALGPFAPDVLRAARHQSAARDQARLSPPFPPARQCRPDAAGGRRRDRLLHRADGAGHPPHHRAPSSPRAMRRRRRPSSTACCPSRVRCFRSASRPRSAPGWEAGRALRIPGR